MINAEDTVPLDAILPAQFLAIWSRRALSPELTLALRILEQAVVDIRVYRRARDRRGRRLYWDAYDWITSADRVNPFSFLNLCAAFGFAADALRTRLLEEGEALAA